MYEDMVTDARPHLPQIQAKTTVLYAFDSTMGLPQAAVDSLYDGVQGLAAVRLIRIEGAIISSCWTSRRRLKSTPS